MFHVFVLYFFTFAYVLIVNSFADFYLFCKKGKKNVQPCTTLYNEPSTLNRVQSGRENCDIATVVVLNVCFHARGGVSLFHSVSISRHDFILK